MLVPVSLSVLLISSTAAEGTRVRHTEPFQVQTVYTVKQQGGGLGIEVDEIVLFQLVKYRNENVWVVERRRHDVRMGQRTFQHQWIDGRICASLEEVLTNVGRIPAPRFAGPRDSDSGWMSDTAYVTLIGPSLGGRSGTALMQRDLGGEIAKWWRKSEKALASCWQDRMVLVGDGTVLPKLGTDEDAVAAGRP